MTLPGVVIERRDQIPVKTPPVSVGTAFMAGICDRGSVTKAEKCVSLGDFVAKYGPRISTSVLYDAVDTFFHEGGSEVWISRVTGPAATTATGNLLDQSGSTLPGDVALVVNAKSPGDWGNSLNVAVVAGLLGSVHLVITHDTDPTLIEVSPDFSVRTDMMNWANNNSKYVNMALGASNEMPRVQSAVSLTGGATDTGGITDAERLAAMNRFGKELGPGQVAFPGSVSATVQGMVLDHAIANNRVAILDGSDTATILTLQLQVSGLRNSSKRERFGGIFAPWDVIPGLVPNTTRVVPPCARVMGACAKLAAAGKNGNVAAAGNRGRAEYVIGLSQVPWTNADRETLNDSAVNVSIIKNGIVTTYGWRTMTDPIGDVTWSDLGGTRIFTQIAATAEVIVEDFVFEEIDGEGRVFRRLEGVLKGMLLPFYQAGSLYGRTQNDAFIVDTGASVNTPETIAARQINGDIGLKTSPHGEIVKIRISKAAIAEAL
jgi:hypothetical protein